MNSYDDELDEIEEAVLSEESTEILEIELKDSLILKIQEFCDLEDISFDEFFIRASEALLDKNYDF